MKKASKSRVSLPSMTTEQTQERFVIEVERNGESFALTFAGCLSERAQQGKKVCSNHFSRSQSSQANHLEERRRSYGRDTR